MSSKDSDDRTDSGQGRGPLPDDRSSADLAGSSKEGAPGHPEFIGPYRILEILGEGGMAVVYRAQQYEPVRREVALKVVRLGLDSQQVLERFERERQALAIMEHPSIAQVYDAGISETGRPYFVMEIVRGVRLDQFCDERSLTTRERIRLFIQVCGAVQHAHQKGVIHRDLKPSNVLVTDPDGTPLAKIIDFGIAKATEEGLTEQRFATRTKWPIGTPMYMSPEQVGMDGLDVDTRTDIYSLGVMLYQLLVGDLPFDRDSYRGWGAFGAVLVREPPAPSYRVGQLDERTDTPQAAGDPHRTGAPTLSRELKGDLDCIVMKAMEKERDRRYETANGLAMDLRRYLDDQPVLARAPSRRYWAKKFVRRHRAAVGLGSALGVLLVGFAVTQFVQARILAQARDTATSARDVAERRRAQAEGVLDFILSDLRDKLEPVGRLDLLDDVGGQAMAYFAAIPEGELSDQELSSRSQALYQIGDVRLIEGNAAEAVAAFRESLRLARELSARDPEDLERLFGLSQSHYWLGYAAYLGGELGAAEVEFQAYLQAAERLVEQDEANLEYRMELAYAHSNIGSVREARGDLEGAVEAYSGNLATVADLVERRPDDLEWLGELAESHNLLGVVYQKLGRYDKALEEHRREYQLKTQLLDRNPAHAYWRYRLAMAHHFMGRLQGITGDVEGALRNQEAGTAILDVLVAYDEANTEWRRDSAVGRGQLAITLGMMGRRSESLRAFRDALSSLEDLVQTDSTGFEWRQDAGMMRSALARALVTFEEPERALQEAETAQRLLADSPAEGQELRRARSDNELAMGHALAGLGRDEDAREAWNRALTALQQLVEGPGGAEFQPLLAEAYVVLDRTEDARRELEDLGNRGYREFYLRELATKKGIFP